MVNKTRKNALNKIAHNQKGKTYWTSLNKKHDVIAEQIINAADSIRAIVADPNVRPIIDASPESTLVINGLARDLVNVTERLATIKAQHCDRKGVVTTPSDYNTMMNIISDYEQVALLFSNVTTVAGSEVFAQIGGIVADGIDAAKAQKQAAAEAAEAALIDPNVVTDVEVKEPIPETTAACIIAQANSILITD